LSLATGTRLGPYEILAPLGAGGMGEVWKARDTRLERTVAIKVLPSATSSSPEVRRRFEQEARTISQLSHPHICALYDVGREGETEYLVMEYLEGETLAERLAKGSISLEQTLRYGTEIAEALDRAHRHGIVHRDLKPGNVMLTKSGVKLLDFGLAKALSFPGWRGAGGEGLTSLPTQANLTQEGTILGTFQYMAPEQLEGKGADHRTDIFALGATLYEMATGRKAFSGSSQASLVSAIMSSEPPPISSTQPLAPRSLERLVRRCLAKDPERRWQSAGDLALELAEASARPEPEAEPTQRSGWVTRGGWIAAATLLVLLVASLLAPRRAPPRTSLPKLRVTILPPAGTIYQGMLSLSPDGRLLTFSATGADGKDFLYLRPLDSLDSRMLAGTEGAMFPFWSPDSRSVGFFAQRKLKRIDVAGGSTVTLCDALEPRGGSWGSRGTIVFSANGGGEIHRVPENGGQPVVLPALVARKLPEYRWPCFLPDGRHFLYFTFRGGVEVASLDSNETKRIVKSDAGAVYAAPGFLVYRSGDHLVGQRFDPDRLALEGSAFPIVDNVWWDSIATGATAVSVSETGLLALQTGGAVMSRLTWYDRSGRELGVAGPDGAYFEPSLSPDDRWLAVARFDPEKLAGSIWTIDLQRGSLTRLSSRVPMSATPLWSGDGRRLAYSSPFTGEVFVRDVRGAGEEALLFKNAIFAPLDDWSRDGRNIFFDNAEWRKSHLDVWVRDLQAGSSRPLLQGEFNHTGARLSPDGRWLAYESDEAGAFEIFVRSFPEPGERRQLSAGGGRQPRWRGDGGELFYVSPDRKIVSVEIRPGASLEASAARPLFQTRIRPLIEARNHYDVTADGQRFVVNSGRAEDASLPIAVLLGWMPEAAR
jgi:serine/threonine protein kinase/Tol biopolymer transport system component